MCVTGNQFSAKKNYFEHLFEITIESQFDTQVRHDTMWIKAEAQSYTSSLKFTYIHTYIRLTVFCPGPYLGEPVQGR